MNLVTLDFGNSHPHAGLFEYKSSEFTFLQSIPLNQLKAKLDRLNWSAHNTQLVLSQVRAYDDDLNALVDEGFVVTSIRDYWKGNKFAGMPVNYANSLGEDRLIQAFYLFKNKKFNKPLCLIDAGTYTTMDFITSDGLVGGYIAPGISAYPSVYNRGENLKSRELDLSFFKNELPHQTEEAMSNSYGAFPAFASFWAQKLKIQNFILTGGSHSYWENALPSFLNCDLQTEPDLIHYSLHYWYTTQIQIL